MVTKAPKNNSVTTEKPRKLSQNCKRLQKCIKYLGRAYTDIQKHSPIFAKNINIALQGFV